MIILITVLLIIFNCVVFDVPFYAVFLALLLIGALFAVSYIVSEKYNNYLLTNVTKTVLMKEVPIYKRVARQEGFTVSFEGYRRVIYRYENVLEGYDCIFRVYYESGNAKTVKCKKGSKLYNELVSKTSSHSNTNS